MKQLESFGYQALAVGHFEDDLQVSYTTDVAQLMDKPFLESIRAAMINGIFFLPNLVFWLNLILLIQQDLIPWVVFLYCARDVQVMLTPLSILVHLDYHL